MKVLITAGPVYGRLDDNKLVSNRTRGIWATHFAEWLMRQGHDVTLLVADTNTRLTGKILGEKANVEVVAHTGFDDYRDKCYAMAETHDAAVMASAVVNWIPRDPILGKMVTKGYKEGDVVNIPFVLAERVIDRMRRINPKLTLIGCKMLVLPTYEELIDAAYHGVILTSKANVVLANDLTGLRTKYLVYPDRTVQTFDNDWERLYEALHAVIQDEHWTTEWDQESSENMRRRHPEALALFDRIVDKYRDRFSPRGDGKVFGSLLVPIDAGRSGFLVSPREKSGMFSSADAVWLPAPQPTGRTLLVGAGSRATMNAPLLLRVSGMPMTREVMECSKYPVLHLHEQLQGVPTVPYAPPGTDRDNMRRFAETTFNIEGHGFIACLDTNLEIMQ